MVSSALPLTLSLTAVAVMVTVPGLVPAVIVMELSSNSA